jgi:threonylcarbamoyladenosine tRNA methylthiotransferase MtaB
MEKRKERSKMLHILSDKKKRAFYEQNIGSERTVLFEAEEDEGMMYGFTENYVKVKVPFNASYVNSFQKVKLTAIDRDGIMKVEVL